MSPAAPVPADFRDHYILCGGGTTARVIIEEILRTGRRFVVIEQNHDACDHLRAFLPPELVMEADATDEEVLLRAGVRGARALLATLQEDKLNLVITVTAAQLNPALRVVARGNDEGSWPRLKRAGALVVSTAHIGGRRLATGMIHPEATVFLNEMLYAPSEKPIRIEAVVVTAEGGAVGKSIAELDIYRRTGLQVIATCNGEDGTFTYNPGNAVLLAEGDRLFVIGDSGKVDRLAGIVGRWE